jgi:hypothetical protein
MTESNKNRAKSRFSSIIKYLVKNNPNYSVLGEKVKKITEYTYG